MEKLFLAESKYPEARNPGSFMLDMDLSLDLPGLSQLLYHSASLVNVLKLLVYIPTSLAFGVYTEYLIVFL